MFSIPYFVRFLLTRSFYMTKLIGISVNINTFEVVILCFICCFQITSCEYSVSRVSSSRLKAVSVACRKCFKLVLSCLWNIYTDIAFKVPFSGNSRLCLSLFVYNYSSEVVLEVKERRKTTIKSAHR